MADGNPDDSIDEVNDAKLCVKKLADAASKIFEAESEMSSSADTKLVILIFSFL